MAYRKKYKLHYETAYHIFVAKSTDNGLTWHVLNAAQPIETVGDFNQSVPAIAIDGADGLHVVWYGPDEATANDDENQLKYVHSLDGGLTWSAWRNIAPVTGYQGQALWQEHPTIYVDNDNRRILYFDPHHGMFAANTNSPHEIRQLEKLIDRHLSEHSWREVVVSVRDSDAGDVQSKIHLSESSDGDISEQPIVDGDVRQTVVGINEPEVFVSERSNKIKGMNAYL